MSIVATKPVAVHTLVNGNDKFEFRPVLSSCNVRYWRNRRCRHEEVMTREAAREKYAALLKRGWVRW